MSKVIVMLEWPSISETIFEFTLRERSSVAHLCLRSWKRTGGNLARFNSAAKDR